MHKLALGRELQLVSGCELCEFRVPSTELLLELLLEFGVERWRPSLDERTAGPLWMPAKVECTRPQM